MAKKTEASRAPRSTDLEGWRLAIIEARLPDFRLESLVAAMQDLGPGADAEVLRELAKHLSDALMGIIYKYVSPGRGNLGIEFIEDTHSEIFTAILQPESADGKAMRDAFAPRVRFRIKDAIRDEARHARIRTDLKMAAPPSAKDAESDDAPPQPQLELLPVDPSDWLEEWFTIKHLLEQTVADDRKRLAFHLHMEGVPYNSTKEPSMSSALGISDKTARQWVKEVRELLSTVPEVQEILKSRMTRVTP